MKVKVTFRDPEAIDTAIEDVIDTGTFGPPDGDEDVLNSEAAVLYSKMAPFVDQGEYVTILFDTTKGTATVVPTDELGDE
jgi:hypothetical protein